MLHLIPALVCGIVAVYATEAAWDAWRETTGDGQHFDVAWPAFATLAALLSLAGVGISLTAAVRGLLP